MLEGERQGVGAPEDPSRYNMLSIGNKKANRNLFLSRSNSIGSAVEVNSAFETIHKDSESEKDRKDVPMSPISIPSGGGEVPLYGTSRKEMDNLSQGDSIYAKDHNVKFEIDDESGSMMNEAGSTPAMSKQNSNF